MTQGKKGKKKEERRTWKREIVREGEEKRGNGRGNTVTPLRTTCQRGVGRHFPDFHLGVRVAAGAR